MEINTKDIIKREKLKVIFSALWDVLELSERDLMTPNFLQQERRWYYEFGKKLLGNELPEKEVKC